jgi:anthranilate/para-aminobenzoate synthase component I
VTEAEFYRTAFALADQPCLALFDSCGRRDRDLGKWAQLLMWSPRPSKGVTWPTWKRNVEQSGHWWAAALSYELGRRFEPSVGELPPATLMAPEVLAFRAEGLLGRSWSGEMTALGIEAVRSASPPKPRWQPTAAMRSSLTKRAYLAAVRRIKHHIVGGDIYEANLCVQFAQRGKLAHPLALFRRLCQLTPAGMAAYVRVGNRHVISISPERLLQHRDGTLATQPIKGTLPRGSTPAADAAAKRRLATHERFRAENVMIVDLARHELNRVSVPGSVEVPRLFEVQSFRRLHHLVSTVTGTLRPDVSPLDALASCYPAGSMTGAPKVAAMKHLAQIEPVGRGSYSGAVGYVDPSGDFDFNVVIRTLIYDEDQQLLTWHVGGAITSDSDPEAEWAEALLKGQALREALDHITLPEEGRKQARKL